MLVERGAAPPPSSSPPANLRVAPKPAVTVKPAPVSPQAPLQVVSGDAEHKYAYYSSVVRSHKGHLEAGVDTVLALRGVAQDNKRHDSSENVGPYNDTFVLLRQTRDGRHRVRVYPGSTHAGQETSTLSPGGVAQLKPGSYLAFPHGDHNGMPSWHLTTQRGEDGVPAWRDADGDGYISRHEKKKRGLTASGILLHNGNYADHGSSIGCQVLPPPIMQSFIREVGVNSNFNYTLVDANS